MKHPLPNSLLTSEDWNLVVLSYLAVMLMFVLTYGLVVKG